MPKERVRRIAVYVVLPPRALLLDVAGPLEVLRRANLEQTAVAFDVTYVGPCSLVHSSIGLRLADIKPLPDTLPDEAIGLLIGNVDRVMAPIDQIDPSRDSRDEAAIVRWLREAIRPGHKMISICSGAVLAGRAGLLDGRACTTHHSSCKELAKLAPLAKVLENRLYIEDGDIFTSAGVTAGVDLMLHIVSQLLGYSVSAAIARYLVVYLRRSGGDPQLSPWLEGRNHLHPAVHRAQDAIAGDPADQWTRTKIARVAGASGRHLSRLFHEHAGMSIVEYRNRLRVAVARELISQTDLPMESVAERAGFESARQLRRAWGRVYETSPRQVRSPQVTC